MGRRCTVCDSPAIAAISAALKSGDQHKEIAQRFGLSADAVGRHVRSNHIPDAVIELELLELTGDDPAADARAVLEAAGQLVNRAIKAASLDLQIRALEACGKQLERAAKLWGQMPSDTPRVPLVIIVNRDEYEPSRIEPRGPECLPAGRS